MMNVPAGQNLNVHVQPLIGQQPGWFEPGDDREAAMRAVSRLMQAGCADLLPMIFGALNESRVLNSGERTIKPRKQPGRRKRLDGSWETT